MKVRHSARKASPGQVAAAKLLVKREREGKVTVTVSPRIRAIAEQGKPDKVA
ncbi:RNA helicase [Corynebacterium hansenii]|uniref:RNA helicase n=1 Tax=Corynebacterium hansenii TaxID=394964 RepID=A0ABV7ZR63_9CORY|nr:RNA helicase [Corynebacterium hansenii]WJZ00486.1 hypothetical protein CHAN_09410 [Corynebacterium hansenii]